MTFHVGQKVVCVDDSPGCLGGTNPLRVGQRYVITELSERLCYWTNDYGVKVAGATPGPEYSSFFRQSRFRPIVEKKTNISIFTKMLTDTRDKVSA